MASWKKKWTRWRFAGKIIDLNGGCSIAMLPAGITTSLLWIKVWRFWFGWGLPSDFWGYLAQFFVFFLMRGLSMVKHHGEIVVKHYCLVGSEMLLVSIPTNGVVVHHYPQWLSFISHAGLKPPSRRGGMSFQPDMFDSQRVVPRLEGWGIRT
jgi:hypothetical protein